VRIVFAAFFFCFLLAAPGARSENKLPVFPEAAPAKKLWVGEKLVYAISYLGVPVGRAEAEVRGIIQFKNRKAYHVVTKVRSYTVIDFFYKVRDEHHSYIDTETLASLRYEKNIHEGRRQEKETIEFDPGKKTAAYLDAEGRVTHEMEVPEGIQDAMSCGYWSRSVEISPNSSLFIPVNAEKRNWNLEVKFYDSRPMEIEGVGSFLALESEPLMEFQGIFFRRGKIRGWISLDARRIPLRMKVKIPVLGQVSAVLKEYTPGKNTGEIPGEIA
jgi:hypothetical protein